MLDRILNFLSRAKSLPARIETLDSNVSALRDDVGALNTQVKAALSGDSMTPQIITATSQEIVVRAEGYFLVFPASQLNHALSYLNPGFDLGMRRFVERNATPGTCFVDIGANAGVLSAVAAQRIGADGEVITVEPIDDLAHNIARNIFLNAPMTPHRHHICCAGDTETTASFDVFEFDNRVSTMFEYESYKSATPMRNITVPVKPVTELIPEGTNNLLIKIDAEGAELDLLQALLGPDSPLEGRDTLLAFEYASEHSKRAGEDPARILELLEDNGLTAHYIEPSSGVLTDAFGAGTLETPGNLAVKIPAHRPAQTSTGTSSSLEDKRKTELKKHIAGLLERPMTSPHYTCPCCGTSNEVELLERKDATCMISGLELKRHVCGECDLIFGPMQLIQCAPEDLGRIYELWYADNDDGNSQLAQEKTFYLLNPSPTGRYLNYACGDWDAGIAHLRALGWDTSGYEPFQVNRSEFIYKSEAALEDHSFDGVFSHNYLEHVQDPAAFFASCSKLIKPGGSMAQSTPCYAYVFEGSPAHLFFPGERAVTALAQRTGFEVSTHVQTDRDSADLAMQYECYVMRAL